MTRLSDVFDGWGGYQVSLIHAIEPLSPEQLRWRPSPAVRSIGQLVRHISMGRINWFVRMGAPGSADVAAKVDSWTQDGHGNRYVAEEKLPIDSDAEQLVKWMNATWEMIDATLNAWTVEDLSATYRHVFRGVAYEVPRQWTIWRIMAHDIHHGGQIARVLAERGIEAFELRALGGHIISPRIAKSG